MKGRTTCPKCKKEFVLDVPDTTEEHEVVCPECGNKFAIKAKNSDPESDDDFYWEEHGEPRKTILSSIKTKTNKPMIAAILLSCVFALGITSAAFSETFIESSMNIASGVGITGSVEIIVNNETNVSLADINITIDDVSGTTNESGLFFVENVGLGIKTLTLSGQGYKTQTREILVTPLFKSENTIMMTAGDGEETKTYFDTTGCTFILAIFSIFALVGTVASLKRKYIDVAIAGSLFGIFSFGFFFLGSIFSIIAFAIVMKSKEEFENGKKGKIF